MNPDRIVDKVGRTATIYRLENVTYNDYDDVDKSNSDITSEDIKLIVSQPSDEIEHLTQGLGEVDRAQVTVKSDLDIKTNRNGRADRIDLNASNSFPLSFPISFSFGDQIYEVVEVNRDEHPFVNMYKQTALLESMDTREWDD